MHRVTLSVGSVRPWLLAAGVVLALSVATARAAPPGGGEAVPQPLQAVAEEDKLDPFDFVGPHFLGFYLELVVLSVVAAAFLRRRLRKPNDEPPREALDLDAYELACLVGRQERAVNAALASLVQSQALTVDASERTVAARGELPRGAPELERVIHAAARGGKPLREVRSAAALVARALRARLEELGLLVTRNQARRVVFIPMFLVLSMVAFGLIKIQVGLLRHKPIGFLVAACVGTALVAFLGFVWPPYRSRRGDRALAQLRKEHAALEYTAHRRPTELAGADLRLAIGLFGLGVLAGGPLSDLRTALQPPDTAGTWGGGCGGSSCGSGGYGGGGCGGGGCGGCGGG